MGRPKKFYSRKTVEKCLILDLTWLRKRGFFNCPQTWNIEWTTGLIELKERITIQNKFNEFIGLSYVMNNRVTNERQVIQYDVELIKTPCNFGGFRYWFKCPGIKNGLPCNRLATKLYLPPIDDYFLCRHCYDQTYRERQRKGGFAFETGRLVKKIRNIDEKLKKRLRYEIKWDLLIERGRLIKILKGVANNDSKFLDKLPIKGKRGKCPKMSQKGANSQEI